MKFQIPYAAKNAVDVPAWGDFAFGGEVGARIDRFITESMTGKHAREDIFKEAELCFRDKEDDIYHYGLWRGEFWGKLMISAVRVCRMKKDETYKSFLREATYALLQYQREDGYLSTYKNSKNVFRADTSITIKECGWKNYFNWNVWSRKYTLWGLLEAAMLLDDDYVLACADKLASQMINDLDELGVRCKDTGVMDGMPSCSIMKPILILYRLTGKEKYRDFAVSIAAEWDRDDNEAPNLIRNALSSTSPSRWHQNQGEIEWCAKAYEMMSCFDGLAELYRVTGTKRYLDALESMYQTLIHYESNILGSVSYCEHFAEAAYHPDAATEICDVVHWMRLCHELYAITGKVRYIGSMERAFVNAFLAGMYQDGKSCSFFIRSQGRHWDAVPQCSTKYQHCCYNNLPRGFVNAAQSAVMQGKDVYYINMWLPSAVSFNGVTFTVGDGYTTSGRVSVNINSDKAVKVALRIPEWSRKTEIEAGGQRIVNRVPENTEEARYGQYITVGLPAGQSVLTVQFDMTAHIIDFTYPVDSLPDSDYHVRRWSGNKGTQSEVSRDIMLRHAMSTVQRGAVIMARSKVIGSSEDEMFSQKTVCGQGYRLFAENVCAESGFLCRMTAKFVKGDESFTYEMCDFASAANDETCDPKHFTLFV